MGGLSLWHWIIVLLVVLILFGRGRISDIMGDFGKGIKSFKEGINEESDHKTPPPTPAQIAPQPVSPVDPLAPPVVTPAPQPVAPAAPAAPAAPVSHAPHDTNSGS